MSEGAAKMTTTEYLQYELRTAAWCEAQHAELVVLQSRHDIVAQVLPDLMDLGDTSALPAYALSWASPSECPRSWPRLS